MAEKYYVVLEGRGSTPIIYSKWEDWHFAINKYAGAKSKSFKSLEKALEYIGENTNIKTTTYEERLNLVYKNKEKSKYYVVFNKKEETATIYDNWEDWYINVRGRKNVQTKSFLNIQKVFIYLERQLGEKIPKEEMDKYIYKKSSAKKYYVVLRGRGITPIIYDNKIEFDNAVKNYSGSLGKGFNDMDKAFKYLEGFLGKKINPDNKKSFIYNFNAKNYCNSTLDESNFATNIEYNSAIFSCYVDGSYKQEFDRYSYSVVGIEDDELIYSDYGLGNDLIGLEVTSVAGELYAAYKAISYAIKNNYGKIIIHHDYEGIQKYAIKQQAPKNGYIKRYCDFIDEAKKLINIQFVKVEGHSGDKWNDYADELASKAYRDIFCSHLYLD